MCYNDNQGLVARRFESMIPERLNILCPSHLPASPTRFGAQARMHGLNDPNGATPRPDQVEPARMVPC